MSQEEYVNAAVETAADAIIVSSLYGHAELIVVAPEARRSRLEDLLLYVGGNIVVGKQDFTEVRSVSKLWLRSSFRPAHHRKRPEMLRLI